MSNMRLLTLLLPAALALPQALSADPLADLYRRCGADQLQRPAEPTFNKRSLTATDRGATPDGLTLCTEPLQGAIDELAKQGGGTLQLTPGIYLTAPLELKSGVCLYLQRGALLLLTPDKTLHRATDANSQRCRPGIYAKGANNIGITGQGVIDGNGQYWRPVKRAKVSDYEWKAYHRLGGSDHDEGKLWLPHPLTHYAPLETDAKKDEGRRADLIRVENCQGVLIEGVTVQNSPRFHVHPCQCSDLVIRDVTVRCPWNAQNGDGIDLSSCQRALVLRCVVDVGDDGICMKSGVGQKSLGQGACQHILIADCTVCHAHGGFVIGSDCANGHHHITVSDCLFSGTDTGLRFKSGVGRGGRTDNIDIHRIVMNDIAGEAIVFECTYKDTPAVAKKGEAQPAPAELVPEFQGIAIDQVTCRGARTAVKAKGLPGLNTVHDVKVTNSTIFYTETARDVDENCRLDLAGLRLVSYN